MPQEEPTEQQPAEAREPRKPNAMSRYMGRFLLCFLSCAALFVAFTAWHTWRITHTHVIVYRLLPGDGAEMTQADAEAAGRIMVERAHKLGKRLQINHAEAKVLSADSVELTFRSPLEREALQRSLTWLTLQGHVQFLLARPGRELTQEEAEAPQPEGTKIAHFYDKRNVLNYPGDTTTTRRPYRVLTDPMLECTGFQEISLETHGLDKLVVVTMVLASEYHKQFATQTALNVGRMMVMLVDGHMLLPPREIGERIGDGKMVVGGYFELGLTRKFVAVMQAGALPAPLEAASHTVDGRPVDW